jgi:nitrogen fixation protein NifU and related proteins
MLEELYQEIILDHYRRPRNKGKVNPADLQAREYNPLCGDDVEVTAKLTDGKIAEIKFDGHACTICTASASIMTQKLKNKTLPEASALAEDFQKMMRGEAAFGGKEMGDLKALEGVLKFPVRVKCATLPWHAMQSGIRERSGKL